MDIKVAVLVDGSFFLKRYKYYRKKIDYSFSFSKDNAKEVVKDLYSIVLASKNEKVKKQSIIIAIYIDYFFMIVSHIVKENITLKQENLWTFQILKNTILK